VAKIVHVALSLTKQPMNRAWRQRPLRDYRLAAASFPKAKASPQPCFTSAQVDALIEKADGQEKAAFALLGFAGLRIGEVEQLRWEDLRERDGQPAMIDMREKNGQKHRAAETLVSGR
jgi:integrase